MKRILTLIIAVACALSVTACTQDDDKYDYYISYIDKDTTTFVDVGTKPQSKTTGNLVDEFVKALKTDPEKVEYYNPITEETGYKKYEFNDGTVKMYFGSAYRKLDTIKEVLTRSAIVNTLTQIEGVYGVEFFVNNKPLKDASGNEIGLMRGDDIIENPGEQINTINEYTIKLYFANSAGNALVPVEKKLYANTSASMEKLVMEELLKGPSEADLQSTIPMGTNLVSVSFLDGVCFVNLSDTFLTPNYNLSEEVIIYSIVNSLTALDEVEYVQISINGDTSGVLREKMSFETLYEQDLSLVKDPIE